MTSIWEYLGSGILGLYGILLVSMYRWQMTCQKEANKAMQRLAIAEAQIAYIVRALEGIDNKLQRLIEREK